MSGWNHTVVFVIPVALVDVAKRISRSLDPDVGGDQAFQTLLSSDGKSPATHAIYSTPVRASFLETLAAVTAAPSNLKYIVDQDYDARWPDEVKPTLGECVSFLAALQTFIDRDFYSVIDGLSLRVVE